MEKDYSKESKYFWVYHFKIALSLFRVRHVLFELDPPSTSTKTVSATLTLAPSTDDCFFSLLSSLLVQLDPPFLINKHVLLGPGVSNGGYAGTLHADFPITFVYIDQDLLITKLSACRLDNELLIFLSLCLKKQQQ